MVLPKLTFKTHKHQAQSSAPQSFILNQISKVLIGRIRRSESEIDIEADFELDIGSLILTCNVKGMSRSVSW